MESGVPHDSDMRDTGLASNPLIPLTVVQTTQANVPYAPGGSSQALRRCWMTLLIWVVLSCLS